MGGALPHRVFFQQQRFHFKRVSSEKNNKRLEAWVENGPIVWGHEEKLSVTPVTQ